MTNIELPPMSHNLWGTDDEQKPLSPSMKKMLAKVLGTSEFNIPRIPAADIKLKEPVISPAALADLTAIVGADYITQDHEQRVRRARGKSYLDLLEWRSGAVLDAPDAILVPGTEEEILQILQYCSQHQIAVVTFGGGTSVVGGLTPKRGDNQAVITLDMRRFDKLEDVDDFSMEATLGAGLSGPHAEMLLSKHGLQLGHFPQSFPYASIGGYAVTRSSGQNSAGYGRFDEMVRSFIVVTPKGIAEIGKSAPSSAAGPDVREIFMGSEGTLGIVTRVRVRVHRIPEVKRYEAFSFPTFAKGIAAVKEVEQQQTGPTVIRLSDEIESAVNLTSTDKIGESNKAKGCVCLTVYEGTEEHTASRHAETRELLLKMGATSLGEGPARQWEKGRFGAPVLRDALIDCGAVCETLETATDWSNAIALRKAVVETLASSLDGAKALVMCHVSHVYAEGCSLYFTVVSSQSDNPIAQWRHAKNAVCEAIVETGGTITHHHGMGSDHRPFMVEEIGELGVSILTAIKKEVDPAGILNPGKLF